ncbi:Peptidoglycan/xylan/chitin deacetylase, PgdA/CDA1 family [Paenibacillus jilunlii]|uniref:Peptidoglycan/xylan/chitin deacetylase, PgdA/CDA1 family n=2 Tax=Paenibacillus jilunlii TaxID=682956 RepID=A0A1G9T3S3_9BACL|nr:polysaccharide deacetylase [Paenibacillus jilunlii]SDM42276.1 Peptidoglycan/xylan/chitin deacetylase, PgdA/CDA1 family [Paenibacillus jilunlii]
MPIKKVVLLFMSFFLCFGILQTTAGAAGANRSLKLGVNDSLTGITAISEKSTYYVPLRALATELKWTLTGLPDGIQVDGGGRTLRLLGNNEGARLQDGTIAKADTFLRDGTLMVPLKISAYLGYRISFEPDKYLLRVQDGSATLDDTAFVSKYQQELAPPAPAEPAQNPPAAKPGKTLYLTFDDGPSATTSELLDILDKYGVKATFFMLGPNMNRYPSQVKRIVEEGNGFGLHGMTHRKEKFYASASAALAEMNGDNAVLRKITGTGTTLIRTPYGSKPYFTKTFRDKVLGQGYHLWDWNVDSDDWKYKEDSVTIYNTVMGQVHKLHKSKTSPIILMHDQKATLKVLPRLLESLKKEGYTFEIITKDIEPVNFWKDKR